MNKKTILLLIIILLQGCGYVPTYSNLNLENKKINIQIVNEQGDKDINQTIKFQLSKYNNIISEKKYLVSIKSNYEKIILSKIKVGSVDQYLLKSIVTFEVKFNDTIKIITIEETANMKTITDNFQESIYEKKIKQNFASTISNKFLIELSFLS